MTNAHTPSPWLAVWMPDGEGATYFDGFIHPLPDGECEDIDVERRANACLIAAAPDLYDALRGDPEMPECISPLGWLKSMIDECLERGPSADCEDPDAWWQMVREVEELHRKGSAAVAKAEGGE